jgi:LysM repeat protein
MFAKGGRLFIIPAMKLALWILPSCALALALSSCGSNSPKTAGSSLTPGPFDSRGNYIEEWADNPSKWRKSGRAPSPHDVRSDDLPEIVLNDQPPQHSIPLPPSRPKPQPVISKTTVTRKPSAPERRRDPVIVKNTSRPTAGKTTATKKSPSKTVATKPTTKKTVVKVKPKVIRYTVKKGDSLSTIASRNGTSVSALKSANGISGTMIRPGQSLTIPKR